MQRHVLICSTLQNAEETQFFGVSAEFYDDADEDDSWDGGQRIERTVTFDRPLRRGMENCRFDLTIEVADETFEGLMTAEETFQDLACSAPLEDGPVFDVRVDRFADRDGSLETAWREYLVRQGIDENHGDNLFRLFVRAFVPVFRYDVTHREVLLMGEPSRSLMVGTQSDRPRSPDAN